MLGWVMFLFWVVEVLLLCFTFMACLEAAYTRNSRTLDRLIRWDFGILAAWIVSGVILWRIGV